MNNKPNLLWITWNIISAILGIIVLISLVDDILVWKAFIPNIIEAYRNIVHFPFRLLRLDIAGILIDSLFIGSLVGLSLSKSLNTQGVQAIGVFIAALFLWPISLLYLTFSLFAGKFSGEKNEVNEELKAAYWSAAIILGFIFILLLNTFLL